MTPYDWEDWPIDGKPSRGFDTMSWVICAAGIIAIMLWVMAVAFGTDFQLHTFTER